MASRLALLHRYMEIGVLFWRVAICYKLTKLTGRWRSAAASQQMWDAFNEWLGALLYTKFMRLGGLWMKTGQYLASRSDFVPDAIVAHLSRMLDSNPQRPTRETLETLVDAWGASAPKRLDSLEASAISCGSIAQVHVGWLRREGKSALKVAVKVQHQDIAPLLRQDLRQSSALAHVLRFLEPNFDFVPILAEINLEHEKELDFLQEASNLMDVRRNLARSRVPVVVPRVISECTTEKVLVMEFCEGESLKDPQALARRGVNLEQLVLRVCEAWARQMFCDGVFNSDAHAGNILVQMHPTAGAIPVLLDFGLCKRLTPIEHVGICQMMHAMVELDGDLIIQAMQNLGFRMVAAQIEPSEVFRDLLFAFRDSNADAESSRAEMREKISEDARRGNVYSKEAKQHVKQGKKAPLEALPGVVVFLFRTIDMLQGLSTRLGVSVPFLRPMALHARQFLLAHAKVAGTPLSPHLPRQSAASLQDQVQRLLHALAETGDLLGAQCCVISRGEVVVDAAAGRMGPIDPRPVRPEHMFQLFEAGCPLLAALVLQRAEQGLLDLDRPIADAWPGFGSAGKQLTVRALLAHASGLKGAMPRRARLRELLDLHSMESHVAGASCAPSTGDDTNSTAAEFEGAPWGWAVAGLLRATSVTHSDVRASLMESVCRPLGLERELKLRVEDEDEPNVVRHTVGALMDELGIGISDLSGSVPDKNVASADAPPLSAHDQSDDLFKAEGLDFERFHGPQQLQLPSTYNLREVRRAGLPGCSMFASARSLARFYAALGSGDHRLGAGSVADHIGSRRTFRGAFHGQTADWSLGIQVGTIEERNGRSRRMMVLGHRGLGGTVGFTVPAANLSVAITGSRLSSKGVVARRVLELVLASCGDGLKLPEGIL